MIFWKLKTISNDKSFVLVENHCIWIEKPTKTGYQPAKTQPKTSLCSRPPAPSRGSAALVVCPRNAFGRRSRDRCSSAMYVRYDSMGIVLLARLTATMDRIDHTNCKTVLNTVQRRLEASEAAMCLSLGGLRTLFFALKCQPTPTLDD